MSLVYLLGGLIVIMLIVLMTLFIKSLETVRWIYCFVSTYFSFGIFLSPNS